MLNGLEVGQSWDLGISILINSNLEKTEMTYFFSN